MLPQTTPLAPPFEQSNSRRLSAGGLPHSFYDRDRRLNPSDQPGTYLKMDLQPTRLAKVHRYLWLAGLSRPSRSLHRQRLMERTIQITERVHEHLIWHESRIFVKPLPEYLLNYEFWERNLCHDESLHQSACGMLLSYAWLVCSRVDLKIAHDLNLLPVDIDFEKWTAFMIDYSSRINMQTLSQVHPRYHFGELRLSRINKMFRLGLAGFSMEKLIWGFMTGSKRYTTFFERKFGWILIVFVYISVILSALQVALGTERFQTNDDFQRFSYAMALLAIGSIFVAVAGMFLVWWTLFWFHLLSTRKQTKKVAEMRNRRTDESI